MNVRGQCSSDSCNSSKSGGGELHVDVYDVVFIVGVGWCVVQSLVVLNSYQICCDDGVHF